MSNPNKKLKVFLPLLFAIVLVLGMFFGFKLRETYRKPFQTASQDHPLDQILHLIDLRYVDSVQLQKLQDNAIQGILKHLDPHSVYISPDRLKGVKEDMSGHYRGIGVAYYVINDTINVTRIIEGSPADKSDLKIGDQILQADTSSLVGENSAPKIVKHLLRGPNNSTVSLKIRRNDSLFHIKLTRGTIPLRSVQDAYFIRAGIGYIRINRFSAQTYSEFKDAIVALEKKDSIQKFILDLRNNPGGYVEAAVNVADEFLDGGKMIVYTKGKNYPRQEFISSKIGGLKDVPLAILVDGHTASASEILSGAIQDWDRGYIIGRQTFGKGLVQEQYRLANGAALRLTVARYYLPSGRLIQRPYKHRMLAYHHDLLQRAEHGELLYKDSIHFKDTVAYYTKIDHRLVHAGGGIMPDIFVPVDTADLSYNILKLYHQHILFSYAHHYFVEHKDLFSQLKSPSELRKAKVFPQNLSQDIKQWAATYNIHLKPLDQNELKLIKTQLKAFIARALWQNNGYYYMLNQTDHAIQKAIKTLKNEPDLTALKTSGR